MLNSDDVRLDKAIATEWVGGSRSEVQRLLRAGRVTVNGVPATAKQRSVVGDRVTLKPLPEPTSNAVAEPIPIEILHEDDTLLVVNKASGMVVHPAPGHPSGTLVNAILHHTLLEDDDATRPGIVHRLDKDTSGLLVVAKTRAAKRSLVAQFQARSIGRHYLALCVGNPSDAVKFDTLHGRHPRDRIKFSARVESGKRAVTHMAPLVYGRRFSLIACRLETGRTHQIRVHLSEAGHALVGDPLYGVRAGASKHLAGQALHAASLAFEHPETGARMNFSAVTPISFDQEALRDGIVIPERAHVSFGDGVP